jgi:hypothetical protein
MKTTITYQDLNAIRAESIAIRQNFPATWRYYFPKVLTFFQKNAMQLKLMDEKMQKLVKEYCVMDEKTGMPKTEMVTPKIVALNDNTPPAQPYMDYIYKDEKSKELFDFGKNELAANFVEVEL